MRLQYCKLWHNTHFTHKLCCMKAQHCFPVLTFFFTFDKGTLCCGDNFWRLFNVRKCSRHITGTCSKNRGRLQSVGWHEWSCSLFPALKGTAYRVHSPSTTMGPVDCQKMGSRFVGQWRRLQKPSMGTCGQGWAANSTQYISLLKWVAIMVLVLWHGSLATCSQVINTTGLRNDYTFRSGLQGLMRGVVWARD